MRKVLAFWLLPILTALPAQVDAATLLSIDLSVANQLTIVAGTGLSDATVSGDDFTGFYLADFYSGTGSNLGYGLVSGDLTTANNPTDNTPQIYRGGPADTGLNIWSFSSDANVSFTAGSQAFSGSATWALSTTSYNDMLAGNSGGSIFFAADTIDDLATATVIGEWVVGPIAPVPLPGSVVLLGTALAGFGLYGRRKRTGTILQVS